MDRLPSLFDGPSTLLGRHRGEPFVVRSANRAQPYEVEAQLVEKGMYLPISTPIYAGDIVERQDPRGGVMEYIVADVTLSRDPFRHGNDHAVAKLREKGHAARAYGAVNVVISGGTNQFAIGNDTATLRQTVNPSTVEMVLALRELLRTIPQDELTSPQMLEVTEAVEEAVAVAESEAPRPNAVKRSLRAAKGVIEELGESAHDGVGDAVRVWSKQAVAALMVYISSM